VWSGLGKQFPALFPSNALNMDLHLCRVTEKGNYTEKDAASIIRQILDGVAYLHSQGMRLCASGFAVTGGDASSEVF
jgi:serine/threonine protein kinase